MMLHFAYGSNMHRAVMHRHAPTAVPLGPAALAHHRFLITADGYASVAPASGDAVHGVLWRITPRDRATLDLWEDIAGGLYRAATAPVRHAGRTRPALVYHARHNRAGMPRAGYMELVIAAAQAWDLPQRYLASLQHWLPARPLGAGSRKLAEFGPPGAGGRPGECA
jgi:hypothetical protein